MSNIKEAFEKKNKIGRKAFIPFVTAGDPSLEATEKFIYALERAGSDIIELGIPFSDPVADGPVIQRANLRAMKNDVHMNRIFDLVGRVRVKTQIPLVFLIYANIIFHYGVEKFFVKCQEMGVDGVIIPDVPEEEKEEFACYANERGVDLISLVAPTSRSRTKCIAENAKGFLYCVSSLGVTGMRERIQTDLKGMFEAINTYTQVPRALGFGISTKEQAVSLKEYADGIIVGSALVKLIEQYGEEAEKRLEAFARDMVESL